MKSLVLTPLLIAAMVIAAPEGVAAQSNEIAEAEQGGRDAADDVIAQIKQATHRQQMLDRRISICRDALKVEDWPAYVFERIDADPTLGPRLPFLEVCMSYLHGRQDRMIEERAELERTLNDQ